MLRRGHKKVIISDAVTQAKRKKDLKKIIIYIILAKFCFSTCPKIAE